MGAQQTFALPTVIKSAIVWGAGTRIVDAKRAQAIDIERAQALVSAALGKRLDASQATHVRSALESFRDGQSVMALIHLAHAGVGLLTPLGDAERRMHETDLAIAKGEWPKRTFERYGPSPVKDRLADTVYRKAECRGIGRAYNPSQPRIPKGNDGGGQWTGDDDSVSSSPAETNTGRPRGVAVADSSSDWTQYFNPITAAHAAEGEVPRSGGSRPNTQHQIGVDRAAAIYTSLGFKIVSPTPVAVDIPGYDTPRVYDMIIQDPSDGLLKGAEIKTTIADVIFLNPAQVVKDAELMSSGGGVARASGLRIEGVAYMALCAYCDKLDVRGTALFELLKLANVPFNYDRFSHK